MLAIESKRIRNFRLKIAKEIPKFPNDKATLKALSEKSLGSLFIDYFNWIIRQIPSRQRKVIVEPTAYHDPRWKLHSKHIEPLLKKIEKGEDLTAYLSIKPHSRGYTPEASKIGVDRWSDKDMLLNIMGYHHFHLQAAPMRSNDMIFAEVTRETCKIIGLFNHQVFEAPQLNSPLNDEQMGLWSIADQRSKLKSESGIGLDLGAASICYVFVNFYLIPSAL